MKNFLLIILAFILLFCCTINQFALADSASSKTSSDVRILARSDYAAHIEAFYKSGDAENYKKSDNFNANTNILIVPKGGTGEIRFTCIGDITAEYDNNSIDIEWLEWDGDNINLKVQGLQAGTSYLTCSNVIRGEFDILVIVLDSSTTTVTEKSSESPQKVSGSDLDINPPQDGNKEPTVLNPVSSPVPVLKQDENRYTDPMTGISYKIPDGWTEEEFNIPKDILKVKFVAPNGLTFIASGYQDMMDILKQLKPDVKNRSDCNMDIFTEEDFESLFGIDMEGFVVSKEIIGDLTFIKMQMEYSISILGEDLETCITQYLTVYNGYTFALQSDAIPGTENYEDYLDTVRSVKLPE